MEPKTEDWIASFYVASMVWSIMMYQQHSTVEDPT